jgi:tRNA threonylcarbamoyladenosine biosynthesis protein TsaB
MKEGVLVALETSGAVASVAVARDGVVLGRRFLSERGRHARGLFPALETILSAGGIHRREIDGVVVGAGPGSFTGVRVGAAAAKGLVHALDVPLYPLSSLAGAAMAEQAIPAGVWPGSGEDGGSAALGTGDRVVAFDARGDRLFTGAYRLGDGPLETLSPPAFRRLHELLEDPALAGMPLCGDGALRHAPVLRPSGRTVLPAPAGHPSADGLLQLAFRSQALHPVLEPGAWAPDYLRATGAERGLRG